jgi:hypothetical protein
MTPSHHFAAKIRANSYSTFSKIGSFIGTAGSYKGRTLKATALVHEPYVRLVGVEAERRWDSRGHFFAAASEAMRRILVDRARARRADKRGGERAVLTDRRFWVV